MVKELALPPGGIQSLLSRGNAQSLINQRAFNRGLQSGPQMSSPRPLMDTYFTPVTAAGTAGYFLYSNAGTPDWTNTIDGGTY